MKTAILTLLAFLISTSVNSQTKTFALGYEGIHFPDYMNTLEKISELNCNLWCGSESDAEHSSYLSMLKPYNFNYVLFMPKWAQTRSWGQQTIYQAEETDYNWSTIQKYKYNQHWQRGIDATDNYSGNVQRVRYYESLPTAPVPVLVLSGADENFEPVGSIISWRTDKKIQWERTETDPINTWYIKPRMRIDPVFAINNPDLEVAKIEIYAYNNINNNIPVKTIVIKAGNFVNQGNYDGRYLEEYFFQSGNELFIRADNISGLNVGRDYGEGPNKDLCKVDFKLYWYGTTDLWVDYVKIEDQYAHELFKGLRDDSLYYEMSTFLNAPDNDIFTGAFTEEVQINNLPCINYINSLFQASFPGDPRARVLSLVNDYTTPFVDKNKPIAQAFYLNNSLTQPLIINNNYQFWKGQPYSENYWLPPSVPPSAYHFNANIPAWVQNEITAAYNSNRTSYSQYNSYLQNLVLQSWADTCRNANELTKSFNPPKDWWAVPQNHHWKNEGNQWMREPLNEELGAVIYTALCNGAKGIMPYVYMTFENKNWTSYDIGMLDFGEIHTFSRGGEILTGGFSKRTENFYGQNKWEFMRDLYGKIKTSWGNVMANSGNTIGYSVHRDGAYHNFITDILSIDPHRPPGVQNPCVFDYQSSSFPAGPYLDCPDERYWEMGFFNPPVLPGDNSKYFMMVNRRCAPAGGGYAGDDRVLRVKFNITSGPLNWQISEVGSSTRPKVFSRNNSGYVDLGVTSNSGMGWFKPGEGKLFKVEPSINGGGTLVEDEIISGGEFTCEAPVYNNGHNITIGANTTIHFNDSSRFVMNGGVFTVGDQNISAPQNITSDAVTGSSWSGHSFLNCEVKIYGATFTGLANDTTYAINIADCPVVDIRNCTFNTNSSLKGGINAVFFSDPNNEITLSNIYIGANTFNSSGSTIPTINISSYAGETTPLIIENNTFNEGNTAIFLSGITGGAIKGNSITDNFIGINALTSAIDIKSNTISSTVNNALGIFAAGGSELKMNNAGSKSLGGLNDLSNSGTAANNIVVDGSVFLLDGGQNIFNITDDQSSKHLYGYFPQFTQGPFDETNNCFKLNSTPVDPPYNMVTSGFQGSQITFNFVPYLTGCDPNQNGDGLAINLGNGIYDTIYNEGSGSGGSQSSVASVRRTDSKIPLLRGVTAEGSRGVFVITTAKVKYDSISVLMRYRNYTQAKSKCIDLINTYPDSIQSLNAISKLFLSTVASDTSYNAVNELKIYYEDLILNHGYNISLVKRANYYILKCKVRMREYTQALAGFQQIINQNPYSYEGLIARWDYMATSLLIQGQGGAFSSIDNEQSSMNNYDLDGNDDDRSPFTKEQRQDIRKSINTAIEISKDEDDRKIKTLEVKSEQGDVNASKELEQIRSLKQVVKTEKPKSIVEHVRIVSEDIRKVFGSNTSSKGNEPKNIPVVFKLSQNYPNPFNPVTKINYDLPKDSKVKIVIYDILGREVKRLVNNELKTAGFYIVDFNAMNYASGVYFYRIEAEEPNGNKFVDSKKMVLLK